MSPKVKEVLVIWPVRYVFVPVKSIVRSLLDVLDLVLDELYWRFDLWAIAPTYDENDDELARGHADYSKVRGFVAFWIAVGLDIWQFVRAKNMPAVVALLTPLGLLAYSLGERVFIAFLKALPQIIAGWRGQALAQNVVMNDGVAETPGKAIADE